MIYSGEQIERLVQQGLITVLPEFRSDQLRPAGLRLHLSDHLLIPVAGQTVDLAGGSPEFEELVGFKEYRLPPGGFVLGSTVEQIATGQGILCQLDGRSTLARVGLAVHNASAFIDGTFCGPMCTVLELVNYGPFQILLRPSMPVAMMVFHQVEGNLSPHLFHAQYAGQQRTLGPRLEIHPSVCSSGRED